MHMLCFLLFGMVFDGIGIGMGAFYGGLNWVGDGEWVGEEGRGEGGWGGCTSNNNITPLLYQLD